MKKFIYGFLVGVIATVLFFSLGGGELFLKTLGKGTVKVEKEIHKSEEAVKGKVEKKVEELKK